MACRKHFIDDKLNEALDDIDAVVILGAGLDTRAYRVTRQVRIPVFEVDQPVNIARKADAVRRVLGELPLSVRLVPLDFERDDLLTALAEQGYRTDYRAFFIWEGVTQYLTEDGVRRTLEGLRAAAPGSRLVFTYVRRDFIDGGNSMAPGRCTATSASVTSCGSSAWSPTRSPGSTGTAGGWWSRPGPTSLYGATSSPRAANSPPRN